MEKKKSMRTALKGENPIIYKEGNYQRMWEEAHNEMSRNPG